MEWMSGGRLSQSVGPVKKKDLSPQVFLLWVACREYWHDIYCPVNHAIRVRVNDTAVGDTTVVTFCCKQRTTVMAVLDLFIFFASRRYCSHLNMPVMMGFSMFSIIGHLHRKFCTSVRWWGSLSPPTSSTMPTSARTTTTSTDRPCRSVTLCFLLKLSFLTNSIT